MTNDSAIAETELKTNSNSVLYYAHEFARRSKIKMKHTFYMGMLVQDAKEQGEDYFEIFCDLIGHDKESKTIRHLLSLVADTY